MLQIMWGFPKIRGTISGVPIIRTIVFWGLYWGPLILGNYHVWLSVFPWTERCSLRSLGDVFKRWVMVLKGASASLLMIRTSFPLLNMILLR